MPNRLSSESSRYLLQHAGNPVDWYPWGEEALTRACAEDKPIFLSIGYSACHWCHVMAHESFEDAGTAAIMNEHFVNIKVDREERSDLDAIYMAAVVAMTGRGGWPMSVFLSPDGRPFYGGTYFPPDDRHGVPAFRHVLLSVARAYRDERERLLEGSDELVTRLVEAVALTGGDVPPLTLETLAAAYDRLATTFDGIHGGFGGAPKFPQPMLLEFLLRYHQRTGQTHALHMVDLTLTSMAAGGMYDHLGGGFHRYATDARWLVPHFEKMLYDNAQLARVYLHAWQVTGRLSYQRVVEETLDYVVREMTNARGGFYSAQDADSEGEEGRYYLWAADEVAALLGQPDGDLFARSYGVTRAGNFEGRNILNVQSGVGTVAAVAGVDEPGMRTILERGRQRLLDARMRRVQPGRDDKVLTSWNGLMVGSFAEAGRVLRRPDYLAAAKRCADFILSELSQDARLLRSWTSSAGARHRAYLEDYACLGDGLLALYQATFEVHWFAAAQTLADTVLAHFVDPQGGFFDTADDHERLVVRPKQVQDNAVPSGNAMMADFLLRLALTTGDARYRRPAEAMLATMTHLMERYPSGFGHWLSVAAFHLAPPVEVAVVGHPDGADTQELLAVVLNGYRPDVVVAFSAPGDEARTHVPLLDGRTLQHGRAAAYVCSGSVCQAPVTTARDLADMLGEPPGGKHGDAGNAG